MTTSDGGTTDRDPVRRLDDPDFPALTMSQAADLLGVQAAFLRSLDSSGFLRPYRSPGGHRRYSRSQLSLAARMRGLLDDGHSMASAEAIVGLQDALTSARADADRLRSDVDRLRSGGGEPPPAPSMPPGRLGGSGLPEHGTDHAAPSPAPVRRLPPPPEH